MTLHDAFIIISAALTDTFLHVDHICSDASAHDLSHCPLGADEAYTAEDAALDTPDALLERV